MENAADNLREAATALKSGNFGDAGENMLVASSNLENAGTELKENDADLSAISDAGTSLEAAGKKLRDAGDFINKAGAPLENAGKYLLSAGAYIENADDNLATAGNLIENAGDNLKLAGTALGSNVPLQADENLGESSDNLSDSASELGLVFGESSVTTAATQENNAGDSLADKDSFGLGEAGDALKSMATDLSSAATKIADTANSLAPADWTLREGKKASTTLHDNDAFFSGIQDNKIAPGASEDFTFVWKSGSSEATFEVWGYKEDQGLSDSAQAFGPVTTTIEVDSTDPTITSAVVTQSGIDNNLVNSGSATLTIEADEELDNLGPINLDNAGTDGNMIPPITWSDLDTSDNPTFTYTFDVGEWDDNSPIEVDIGSATDLFKHKDNNVGAVDNFYVDTKAPIAIENGIYDFIYNNFDNMTQAGTGDWYWVDNDGKSMNISGRFEDDWTAGARLGSENDDLGDVLTVDISWGGNSVEADATQADNFAKNITLSEGVTSDLTVTCTDWAGNSTENSVGHAMLTDTTLPSISFDSINGSSWDMNDYKLAHDKKTFTVSLSFSDSGLGIIENGNMPTGFEGMVTLDDDDNVSNGAIENLENSTPWNWSPSTGATFESTYDNGGSGLVDGTYWINVYEVTDNLWHDGEENVSMSQSFKVEYDVTPPSKSAVESVVTDATLREPDSGELVSTPTKESGVGIRGTASEKGGKVIIWDDGTKLGSQDLASDEDEFEIEVTLDSDGRHDLKLQELDEYGNASEKVSLMTIYLDSTAPDITIDKPTVEETGDPSIDFKVDVSDEVTSAEDLSATLRSPEYTTPEGKFTISADGVATADVPLREGQNQITINVKDEAGNLATKSVTVERTVPEAANWAMYAMFAAIVAIILAAIAVLRRSM